MATRLITSATNTQTRSALRRRIALATATAGTFAAGMLLPVCSAGAASITWGNTGVTWNAGANWIGGVAPANSTTADVAIFQGSPSFQPTLSAQASVGALDIQSDGWVFSGARLTLGTGVAGVLQGINSTNGATGVVTFDNPLRLSATQAWGNSIGVVTNALVEHDGTSTSRSLTLNGTGTVVFNGDYDLASVTGLTTRTITVNGTGTLTVNGIVKNSFGAGTFRCDTSGMVRLTNTGNTYNGGTNIGGGILQISGDGALGAVPGAPAAANISITGSSTLSIASGLGNVTVNGNRGIFINGSASTARTLTFDTGDNTVDLSSPITEQNAGTTTLVVGNFTKQGSGTLVMSSNNQLTGSLNFAAGTLVIANPAALGAGSLRFGGGTIVSTAPLTVNNISVMSSNSVVGGSQTITFGGQMQFNGTTDRTEQFSQAPGIVTQINGGVLLSTTAPRVFSFGGNGEVAVNSEVSETSGQAGTLRLITTGTVHLNAANSYTGGTVLNAGRLEIGADNNLGAGAASVTLDGGTLATRAAVTSSRTLHTGTGGLAVGGTFDSGAFDSTFTSTITGDGGFTKAGSGKLTVDAARSGTVTISAGTLTIATNGGDPGTSRTASVVIPGGPLAPTASLDLNDNDLILTADSVNPATGLVISARNGGGWDGQGITSSSARNHPQQATTLGVLGGADYLAANGAPFGGFTVASTDTLVKYTWYGDSDFTGVVDFDDYVRIDGGFNGGLTGWLNGDFDLSGSIDFDDYVLIDLGFNAQSGTLRRAEAYLSGDDRSLNGLNERPLQKMLEHFAQFGTDYATHFLAAVPEPTAGLTLCGGSACFALIRRRRSR